MSIYFWITIFSYNFTFQNIKKSTDIIVNSFWTFCLLLQGWRVPVHVKAPTASIRFWSSVCLHLVFSVSAVNCPSDWFYEFPKIKKSSDTIRDFRRIQENDSSLGKKTVNRNQRCGKYILMLSKRAAAAKCKNAFTPGMPCGIQWEKMTHSSTAKFAK